MKLLKSPDLYPLSKLITVDHEGYFSLLSQMGYLLVSSKIFSRASKSKSMSCLFIINLTLKR